MTEPENEEGHKKKPFRKNSDDPLVLPKTLADKQRIQIEKLMRNPEKLAFIPDRKKDWSPRLPPEFVRDVMGSSAGAGSGEFHVYRGYRRREAARQTFINTKAETVQKNDEYHEKLEQNQRAADQKTAKKRAKRLKQKQKMLAKKKKKEEDEKATKKDEESESSDASDDSDDKEEKDDDAEENCFVIGGK